MLKLKNEWEKRILIYFGVILISNGNLIDLIESCSCIIALFIDNTGRHYLNSSAIFFFFLILYLNTITSFIFNYSSVEFTQWERERKKKRHPWVFHKISIVLLCIGFVLFLCHLSAWEINLVVCGVCEILSCYSFFFFQNK